MEKFANELLDIPNEPKIPLGNYLLKLIDKKDTIGNSIYIYNIEDFIREIWSEILEKNSNLGVREFIPRKLKMQTSPFYAVLNGKRGISIQQTYKLLELWKIMCKKEDIDIKQKWDQIYNSNFLIASFSKPQKFSLPKFSIPRLAYLIGWIVGDGCFDNYRNHYRLKITEKNKKQLLYILKPIIEETFHVKCFIKKDHPSYCVKIHSKPIFRFFVNVLDIKVGKVPELIKKSNIVIKQYFLRGIFDSEGDVDPDYERSKIRISQASKEFLEDLIELFKEANIAVNGPYGPHYKYPSPNWNVFSKWYHIEIRKKSEIFKFTEKISSSHLDKFPRIELLSEEIKNKYTYFQRIKDK